MGAGKGPAAAGGPAIKQALEAEAMVALRQSISFIAHPVAMGRWSRSVLCPPYRVETEG